MSSLAADLEAAICFIVSSACQKRKNQVSKKETKKERKKERKKARKKERKKARKKARKKESKKTFSNIINLPTTYIIEAIHKISKLIHI